MWANVGESNGLSKIQAWSLWQDLEICHKEEIHSPKFCNLTRIMGFGVGESKGLLRTLVDKAVESVDNTGYFGVIWVG